MLASTSWCRRNIKMRRQAHALRNHGRYKLFLKKEKEKEKTQKVKGCLFQRDPTLYVVFQVKFLQNYSFPSYRVIHYIPTFVQTPRITRHRIGHLHIFFFFANFGEKEVSKNCLLNDQELFVLTKVATTIRVIKPLYEKLLHTSFKIRTRSSKNKRFTQTA